LKRVKRYQIVALLAVAAAAPAVVAAIQPTLQGAWPGELPLLQATHQGNAQAETNPGAMSYANHCAMCHGDHRQGNPAASIPSLINVGQKLTAAQVAQIVHNGRGRMPPFGSLPDQEVQAIAAWLTKAQTSTTASPVAAAAAAASSAQPEQSAAAQAGGALFQQNCAFCHGRDAEGGEEGPDLTRSKLVLTDASGEKISTVIHEGRAGTRMPAFNLSAAETQDIIAFLHARILAAASQQGKRRGVDVSDLQTGNVDEGKAYFNGVGGCSKCHSPTGDLAGVASRYEGLQLEERMLYPRNAKSTVTVTLASGEKVTGTLAYQDEFTIGLVDKSGQYHSWDTSRIHYSVDSPVDAHVELFSKYTDADIHNLMAYIQTLH